ENKNYSRPAAEQQKDGVGRAPHIRDARQAQPDLRQGLRQKGAPWKKPQEQEAVEKQDGNGVVVVRVAFAKIAKKLLVDEVEPEKTLGFAGRGISERREDVPGCRYEQKDQRAREKMHLQDVTQVADQQEEDQHDGAREDHADQALGQDVYRHQRRDTSQEEKVRTADVPYGDG